MHEPTHENGTPSVCYCCGRHSVGVGIGTVKLRSDETWKGDPKFLCTECIMILEPLKQLRRLDPYEVDALDAGMDAVGDFLEQIGKTDFSEMDELEVRMLVKTAWMGCSDGIRTLVREQVPPF